MEDLSKEVSAKALFYHAINGDLDNVKFVIDNGVDVNSQMNESNMPDNFAKDGEVVFFGNNPVLKDVKKSIGTTALMLSSRKGNLNMMSYLIEKGASVLTQNSYGLQAMMLGAGNVEVLKLLLSNGGKSKRTDTVH